MGDTLTLTLPAHPGTFDLIGYFTKASDYGQVSFTLNGQPLGSMFDGYNIQWRRQQRAGVSGTGDTPGRR